MPPWLIPGAAAAVIALVLLVTGRKTSGVKAGEGGATGSPSPDPSSEGGGGGNMDDILKALGIDTKGQGVNPGTGDPVNGGGGAYDPYTGAAYSTGTQGADPYAGSSVGQPAMMGAIAPQTYQTPYGTVTSYSSSPATSIAPRPGSVPNTVQGSVAGVGGVHGNN